MQLMYISSTIIQTHQKDADTIQKILSKVITYRTCMLEECINGFCDTALVSGTTGNILLIGKDL